MGSRSWSLHGKSTGLNLWKDLFNTIYKRNNTHSFIRISYCLWDDRVEHGPLCLHTGVWGWSCSYCQQIKHSNPCFW